MGGHFLSGTFEERALKETNWLPVGEPDQISGYTRRVLHGPSTGVFKVELEKDGVVQTDFMNSTSLKIGASVYDLPKIETFTNKTIAMSVA